MSNKLTEIYLCNKCNLSKDGSHFYFRKDTGSYRKICKECYGAKEKLYREANLVSIQEYQKQYHQDHKKERSTYRKRFYIENKEIEDTRNKKYAKTHVKEAAIYAKIYREGHKEKISAYQKEYDRKNKDRIKIRKNREVKERRKNNLSFRLRSIISSKIATSLKNNGGSKNRKSSLDYLLYSIDDLRKYLEQKFELWMNWKNYGKYNSKTWNDNDSTTWTWNIDHIIPQADLPYMSMEDDNFKKCWDLSNLRPYSAKQNVIDGTTKTRHKRDQND